jgi:hypothetical protein
MNKLFSLFMKLSSPRIPVPLDKQAHFNTGAILAFVAYFVIGYWALLLVAIVAGTKEWYDYKHPNHTSDIYDWVATVLGAIVTLGVIYGT